MPPAYMKAYVKRNKDNAAGSTGQPFFFHRA
jgi:hypothetical protein